MRHGKWKNGGGKRNVCVSRGLVANLKGCDEC